MSRLIDSICERKLLLVFSVEKRSTLNPCFKAPQMTCWVSTLFPVSFSPSMRLSDPSGRPSASFLSSSEFPVERIDWSGNPEFLLSAVSLVVMLLTSRVR
ncbi:hypothetical protein DSECCO2_614870 [anaerobic digester metagenome]